MTRLGLTSKRSEARPLDWADAVDALLELSLSLGPELEIEAIVARCLEQGARLLPGFALGVCLVGDEAQASTFSSGPPKATVRIHLPSGMQVLGQDPTRLFPNLEDEWVLDLGPQLRGGRFHAASGRHGAVESEKELRICERLGRILAIAIHRARMRRDDGDAAAMQALKQQLIQAEKLASLGQVVAGVVHELSNPLTSIVAYASFLKKKALEHRADPGDAERLGRICESAERMLRFTRDLVTYARPAEGPPVPINLHEVIERALVFCEHELERSQIEVQLAPCSEEAVVYGVRAPLTQVFVNLITNAVHAMKQGGCLSLEVGTTDEREVVARVTDQGVGIPSEALGRIFEPFFTTKPEDQGTGLGLAIVQEIVSAHGGRVEVESTLGLGTTFVVILPGSLESQVRPRS